MPVIASHELGVWCPSIDWLLDAVVEALRSHGVEPVRIDRRRLELDVEARWGRRYVKVSAMPTATPNRYIVIVWGGLAKEPPARLHLDPEYQRRMKLYTSIAARIVELAELKSSSISSIVG